jgi:predicted transposase YdaD
MVFAALYREKKRREARQEGREEGREEGRAETNAAWDEWNQRRIQAEANGEPFAEPPPSASNGSTSL